MSDQAIFDAMRRSLQEGEQLLMGLSDHDYTSPCAPVFNASIGGHFRHVLDHFRNLLELPSNGSLDYDRRVRNTPVETDRTAALAESGRLRSLIEALDPAWPQRSVRVSSCMNHDSDNVRTTESSIGREAVFCVMHAVHHYALIRVICGLHGHSLPAEFGVAPSTLAAAALNPPPTGSRP